MTGPLVTVITPTWQRHGLLLSRCVPSVQAQDYGSFEHLIISDGPDPVLAGTALPPNTRLLELPAHDPRSRWGNECRRHGIAAARGDLVAYLDDDDEWLPSHIRLLAGALTSGAGAGFAYSRAVSLCSGAWVRIGDGPLAHGRIVTGMIMHRSSLPAAWPDGTNAPDWETVRQWLDAGAGYLSVDAVTHRHYPSEKTMPAGKIPVTFPPWRKAA
jgi:glycosyltransferase involved in cell wall biosynthesis